MSVVDLTSPPTPDPVGIENCKQLFSPLLAFTTQKIVAHCTDIISTVCLAFFWVINTSRNEKSCLQFLIPTAVFHMLLIGESRQPWAGVCLGPIVIFQKGKILNFLHEVEKMITVIFVQV